MADNRRSARARAVAAEIDLTPEEIPFQRVRLPRSLSFREFSIRSGDRFELGGFGS